MGYEQVDPLEGYGSESFKVDQLETNQLIVDPGIKCVYDGIIANRNESTNGRKDFQVTTQDATNILLSSDINIGSVEAKARGSIPRASVASNDGLKLLKVPTLGCTVLYRIL